MCGEAKQIISTKLWADVKPTEDIEKVKHALKNLCPPVKIQIQSDPEKRIILEGLATGRESIDAFAKKFREQRILEAVRKQLLNALHNDTIIFGMQRQAAYANRFHLCELDDYSAMGPICVEIRANNIRDVIDYISPPTLRGKPQFRKDLKLE